MSGEPLRVLFEHPTARTALTATGGFLSGFTHSCNPVLGCVFAGSLCGQYCYAQHSQPAAIVRARHGLAWGEFIAPKRGFVEALEADLKRAARRPSGHRHHVASLRIFFGSATEPCAGTALPITKACLELLAEYPIARVVVQTRSPQVIKLRRELEMLGRRALVSLTLETDDDSVFEDFDPPLLPRIAARRAAFEALSTFRGVLCSATVSPCTKLSKPDAFADWIARYADFSVVDTFVSGDGLHGYRTARTPIPGLFQAHDWDWEDETTARSLYRALQVRMGERAGWSKQGFNDLASHGEP